MYEHNALGYWSSLALCLTKVRSSRACCPVTALIAYAKTKAQISFAVTEKGISTFVFTTRIVQFGFFLNPKFEASNFLLWLYRLVCVRPGRKPGRPVFSRSGLFDALDLKQTEQPPILIRFFALFMQLMLWL